jgi:hypothetical protein
MPVIPIVIYCLIVVVVLVGLTFRAEMQEERRLQAFHLSKKGVRGK